MKCPNCGAELQTDAGKEMKFCPYCGNKIEVQKETPTTIAGALHGIATSAIKEVGKQLEYNREHADEIQERQIKKDRETMRHSFWMFIISILVVGGIIGFCIYMGEKEKAEKQNSTGTAIVQQYIAADSREKHAL